MAIERFSLNDQSMNYISSFSQMFSWLLSKIYYDANTASNNQENTQQQTVEEQGFYWRVLLQSWLEIYTAYLQCPFSFRNELKINREMKETGLIIEVNSENVVSPLEDVF